jgi:tocopherol O-methyltransferase
MGNAFMADLVELSAIREHYDTLSPLYARLWGEHLHHGYWTDGESPAEAQLKLVEQLVRFGELPSGARVLDVGSGIGGPALWLAGKLGCEVHGITLSPVQVEIARQKARAAGLGHRVHFETHDANQLDFPAQSFDTVWVVECSEHLFDKPQFLRACARVLRPGGVIALAAWTACPATFEHAQLVRDVCRGMLCPALASVADYEAWLQAAGFTGVRAREITRHIAPTWDRAQTLLQRSDVRAVLRGASQRTREFARAFTSIHEAYAVGAMGYAFLRGCLPRAS